MSHYIKSRAYKLDLNVEIVREWPGQPNEGDYLAVCYEGDWKRDERGWFQTEAEAVRAGEEWDRESRDENEPIPLVGGGWRDPRDGSIHGQ